MKISDKEDLNHRKENVNLNPTLRFFPPKFVCKGIEEQAEIHAEAKQAFLEQTGGFRDLRSLIHDITDTEKQGGGG